MWFWVLLVYVAFCFTFFKDAAPSISSFNSFIDLLRTWSDIEFWFSQGKIKDQIHLPSVTFLIKAQVGEAFICIFSEKDVPLIYITDSDLKHNFWLFYLLKVSSSESYRLFNAGIRYSHIWYTTTCVQLAFLLKGRKSLRCSTGTLHRGPKGREISSIWFVNAIKEITKRRHFYVFSRAWQNI